MLENLDYDPSKYFRVGELKIIDETPTEDDIKNYHQFKKIFDCDLTIENPKEWLKISITDDDGSIWQENFCYLIGEGDIRSSVSFPSILSKPDFLKFWFCDIITVPFSRNPHGAQLINFKEGKLLIKVPSETKKKLRDIYYQWLLTTIQDGEKTLVREPLMYLMVERWCFSCGGFEKMEVMEKGLNSIVTMCPKCKAMWGITDSDKSKDHPGFIYTHQPKLPSFKELDSIYYHTKGLTDDK